MGTTQWSKEYKPQRRAEISDIAQAIRDTIGMDDVVRVYAPSHAPRKQRIPCPIHHGEDYNMSFTNTGFKCFVCGASGDVISFVKAVCGFKTRVEAMRRINADFSLHLPIDGDAAPCFSEEAAVRRKKAEERKRAVEEWRAEYDRLWDEWSRLDILLSSLDPSDPDDAEDISVAIAKKTDIEHRLDTLPPEPR